MPENIQGNCISLIPNLNVSCDLISFFQKYVYPGPEEEVEVGQAEEGLRRVV